MKLGGKGPPKFLKAWLDKAKSRSANSASSPRRSGAVRRWGSALSRKLPKSVRHIKFDPKKIELKTVSERQQQIRWGLLVLGIFLLAEITARTLGLFVRPVYPSIPQKRGQVARSKVPTEDFDAILRRNMFNVEGKIPDAFDQGMLDCMTQAKPSSQRIVLHGTIVMADENQSIALIQQEGNPLKLAVKKEDAFFDGKFTAMKVDRKRLCFQVRESQEFEYVEIPDQGGNLGVTSPQLVGDAAGGIVPVSETEFQVKNDFLQKNLGDLNKILQTARAVPYVDSKTGKFQGFLVQSIDSDSPFAQLGIRQGDVLTSVNDIALDNPGKGLIAFQNLRDSKKISLEVIRGGQKQAMTYDVK